MADTKISAETRSATAVSAQYPGILGGTNYRFEDENVGNLRQRMNSLCNEAKALTAYQRFLDMVAFGFKASGDADASSTGGAVDTAAGAWKPGSTAGTDQTATHTSATQSGNTVSASTTTGGFDAYKAFDKVTGGTVGANNWIATAATGWLQYQFGSGKTIGSYTIRSGNGYAVRAPTAWTLRGSNTGSFTGEETVLDTRSGQTGWGAGGQEISYDIASPASFTYYRLLVSANNGDALLQIDEVKLMAPATINNSVLITPYQTADAARTKVRGIFEIDPVDAITLGTDWTVEYTCNGGANWAAASTYTNCGKGQSGRTVVETEEVTCTSGTSFASRIKNLNNKAVHVYKASLKAAA